MNPLRASLNTSSDVGSCPTHGEFPIQSIDLGWRMTKLDQCPKCMRVEAEAKQAALEAKELAERQAKIEARLDQAGIPALFRSRTFDNYETLTNAQIFARLRFLAFAEHFRDHLKTGTVLLGMGKVGTGKSHLACATANYLMARGHTAYFTSTARLFTKIRGTWAKSSEISEEQMLKQFESIDLMILDEVGLQRGTEDEQRTLHELLEARRLNCKPTILLTNLDGANVKQYLGERFWDRLSESGVSVIFNWESHRKQSRDVGGLDNLEAA